MQQSKQYNIQGWRL